MPSVSDTLALIDDLPHYTVFGGQGPEPPQITRAVSDAADFSDVIPTYPYNRAIQDGLEWGTYADFVNFEWAGSSIYFPPPPEPPIPPEPLPPLPPMGAGPRYYASGFSGPFIRATGGVNILGKT